MSVKKKDRHHANNEPLQKALKLVNQVLIITRGPDFDRNGKRVQKPGILGQGQAFQVFGLDLIRTAKRLHAQCYEGCHIKLKDYKTWQQRQMYFREAVECCDSILRQLDLCIYQYGHSKKRRRSFEYVAKLTREVKISTQDRLNRDKLIYEHKYIHRSPPPGEYIFEEA